MPAQERPLIYANLRRPGYTVDIDCYLRHGGYEALRKAVGMKPEEVCKEVETSGLRGRGGAGFPTGMKWKFLDRKSGKPAYLVVNADESEPGTYKDRQIIYRDPHQMLEGIAITAWAIQARQAFIYIRGEFQHGARILRRAIEEAKARGFLGQNILGSGYSCEVVVHRGGGCYVCGEETGLIESLEGKRGYPRIKPPYFPAVLGLYNCPTIVNNAETLAQVRHVLAMGGAEFAKIGIPGDSGTHIWGVSGLVKRPGLYEIEAGKATFGELLYDLCGGPLEGRTFKAIIPGGSSTKILRFGERFKGKRPDGTEFDWALEDIPLDANSIAACGTGLGTGGTIVLDDSVEMIQALSNLNAFYAHETCGQCTPCREGTGWLWRLVKRIEEGQGTLADLDQLNRVADNIQGRTICALGDAAAMPVRAFLKHFRHEFEHHVHHKTCAVPDYL